MRKILFILMAVCTAAYTMAETQGNSSPSITIEQIEGKDMTFAIAQVGKLAFANDSIYLVAHDGNILGKEAQTKTRKVLFGSAGQPTANPQVSDNDILVFPNPAEDHIIVNGLQAGTTIRIYANDGKLLEATTAEGNTATLQVSHLAQGTYLLQINTSIVKFIKK